MVIIRILKLYTTRFLHLDDGNEDYRENVKDGDDNDDDPDD